MKVLLFGFLLFNVLFTCFFGQKIDNVHFIIDNEKLKVSYDLSTFNSEKLYNVKLCFENELGELFIPQDISGDILNVRSGVSKIILCDVKIDDLSREKMYRAIVFIDSTENYENFEKSGNIWMSKNLNVSKFKNGDVIPEAKSQAQWSAAHRDKKPAWCYYNNDPKNGERYGKLYNGYAVLDSRGLAPCGWRISSENDWKTLKKSYQGAKSEADSFLVQSRDHFSALFSGYRKDGIFYYKDAKALWWTTRPSIPNGLSSYCIYSNDKTVGFDSTLKLECGFAVRCLKEDLFSTLKVSDSNKSNFGYLEAKNIARKENTGINDMLNNNSGRDDFTDFKDVKIGKQTWMSKNLNSVRFNNGDLISQAKTPEEWREFNKEKRPAWCYVNFNPATSESMGKIYNWYAVNDSRGLAPKGWKIPSSNEFGYFIKKTKRRLLYRRQFNPWVISERQFIKRIFSFNSRHFEIMPIPFVDSKGAIVDNKALNLWTNSMAEEDLVHYISLSQNINELKITKIDNGFLVRCIKENY